MTCSATGPQIFETSNRGLLTKVEQNCSCARAATKLVPRIEQESFLYLVLTKIRVEVTPTVDQCHPRLHSDVVNDKNRKIYDVLVSVPCTSNTLFLHFSLLHAFSHLLVLFSNQQKSRNCTKNLSPLLLFSGVLGQLPRVYHLKNSNLTHVIKIKVHVFKFKKHDLIRSNP